MKTNQLALKVALFSVLISPLVSATSRYENDTVIMPYVIVGSDLYAVNLNYVSGSNPPDFSLGTYSSYSTNTSAPDNSAEFSGELLSIPSLQVGSVYYQVQLNYVDEVFRLIEEPVLLGNSDGETLNFQLEAWADNWFAAYLNDALIVEDSVSITTERSFNAETASFDAAYPLQLNFILKDFKENDTGLEYIGANNQQMGDGGFIMQLTETSTGDVVAVSNADWQCLVIHEAPLDKSCENESNPIAGTAPCTFSTADEPSNWKESSFDDSSWQNAMVYSEAQVGPKDGYDDIDWHSSAELIWGPDLETTNTLLCRITIEAP